MACWLIIACIPVDTVEAQQGEGIFFSVFGTDAPPEYGDYDKLQAFYFEIPADEEQPLYLRIFDASTSGRYEERHNAFNTRTKFTFLGGRSTQKRYITKPTETPSDSLALYADSDMIYQRTFGDESTFDRRYVSFGPIPLSEGFLTDDGYRRFVLLVEGLEGDDGNYFDLLLSYDPSGKVIPENARSYVYDLTMRIPNWPDFVGKVFVETLGNETLNIFNFDMDSVPFSVEMPLSPNEPLQPSGDGIWQADTYVVQDPAAIQQIGIKVQGRDFNNSFGLIVLDEQGNPMPIPLPIKDYVPTTKPVLSKTFDYANDNCRAINFSASLSKTGSFEPSQFLWKFEDDTLRGANISRTFNSAGYKPYVLSVEGLLQGSTVSMNLADSVYINSPPEAWAGGNRVHVPGKPMAFDGTVSVDPDGYIREYIWDFGDERTGRGARIDHTYQQPGNFTVTLKVVDNSESPCNTDTASANVKINQPPVPVLNVPGFVEQNETFTLDASQSSDPDGEIVEYRWDIGSDTTLFGPVVEYNSTTKNELPPITLTITDNNDVENSTVRQRFDIQLNRMPVAVAKAETYVAAGVPVTLDATDSYDPDGTITNYSWSVDTTNYAAATATHIFDAPGRYTAALEVTDDTGVSTAVDSVQIRVNAPPKPVMSGRFIHADGFVSLSADSSYDPDGSIIQYLWSMGDGTQIEGQAVDHTYSQPGSYSIELAVTDNSGTASARSATTRQVIINYFPSATIEAAEVVAPGQNVRFDGSLSSDIDGTITAYSWDFGDGNNSSGEQTTHSYGQPGIYQIQLKVTDDSGLKEAVGFDHHELRVNHPPVIQLNQPGKTSPNAPVTLDASDSYDPDGTITNYLWYIDGKEWQAGTSVVQVSPSDKEKSLSLIVVDDADVENSRVEQNITLTINKSPIAQIETNKMESGDIHTVQFDATGSVDKDGDQLAYFWDFGDGTTARGPLATHTYKTGGEYRVSLRVDDRQNQSNSVDTARTFVSINRSPVAQFRMPPAVCFMDSVTYNAQATNDPDSSDRLTYNWNFGDGATASGSVVSHSYKQPDTYLVSLVADDNNQLPNSTSQISKSLRVVGNIMADAGENQEVCETSFVTFDASASTYPGSEIENYVWNFGDGTVGRGLAPSHRYTKPGTYDVTLTVMGSQYGSCSFKDTDSMTVTVHPQPEARFDLPGYLVEGELLALDPSPSRNYGNSYQTIRWEITGVDTIRWEKSVPATSDNGPSDEATWSLQSGDIADRDQHPEHDLPIAMINLPEGEHEIKLFIETATPASGCSGGFTVQTLKVVPPRNITFPEIPALTPGQSARFSVKNLPDNLAEFESFTWDMGDGTVKEGVAVSHQYREAGSYNLQFSAVDNRDLAGSRITIDTTIVVERLPSINIKGPELLSAGSEAIFSASTNARIEDTGVSYRWTLPDGSTVSGKNASHQFDEAGWYTVRLALEGGSSRLQQTGLREHTVRVVGPPRISEAMPEQVCPGEPVDIAAGFLTDSLYSTMLNIFVDGEPIPYNRLQSYQFSSPGRYTLSLSADVPDSLDSYIAFEPLRHEVTVIEQPDIKISFEDTVMIGAANDFAHFDASDTKSSQKQNLRFYWNMGDGTQKQGKTIMHRYKSPGSYNVTLTVEDSTGLACGTAKKTITMHVVSYNAQ